MDNPQLVYQKINKDDGQPHMFNDNKEFAVNLLIDCICTLFPNLNKVQIETFVLNLFNNCNEWHPFKETLRDLLISMKSFSSSSDDFYEEERKVIYSILLTRMYIECSGRCQTKRAIEKVLNSRLA